jgi:hypothetical protein
MFDEIKHNGFGSSIKLSLNKEGRIYIETLIEYVYIEKIGKQILVILILILQMILSNSLYQISVKQLLLNIMHLSLTLKYIKVIYYQMFLGRFKKIKMIFRLMNIPSNKQL